uniref:Uncharacterized protein n=1 Tax=Physcomitrium patens TaxID=3218 RepID=A0A2K1K8P7_PHYPA|nr:hypothetical protein PHYPA_012045 [Physcomitrium patens]
MAVPLDGAEVYWLCAIFRITAMHLCLTQSGSYCCTTEDLCGARFGTLARRSFVTRIVALQVRGRQHWSKSDLQYFEHLDGRSNCNYILREGQRNISVFSSNDLVFPVSSVSEVRQKSVICCGLRTHGLAVGCVFKVLECGLVWVVLKDRGISPQSTSPTMSRIFGAQDDTFSLWKQL